MAMIIGIVIRKIIIIKTVMVALNARAIWSADRPTFSFFAVGMLRRRELLSCFEVVIVR